MAVFLQRIWYGPQVDYVLQGKTVHNYIALLYIYSMYYQSLRK